MFTVLYWNPYRSGDASVMNQLTTISQNFDSVATYSSGWFYWDPPVPFKDLNSNVLVATDAAEINKQANATKLTVSQGIFQHANAAASKSEIDTAIKVTKSANGTYPGTVNRLIFSNEYVDTAAKIREVIALINGYRSQVPGVQVGVRRNNLGDLSSSYSELKAAMTDLVKTVDFVMVNIYPSKEAVANGPPAGAQDVASKYDAEKAMTLAVNPGARIVIGETGWPSQGISFNDLSGNSSTVGNEQTYFDASTQWANTNKVTSYYFEAIYEPWKSDQNVSPGSTSNPWQSSAGAEGHFGLYTYNAHTDTGQIVSKFPTLGIGRPGLPGPAVLDGTVSENCR
jgi:exo-beta-1,3-glucanase (GH17 family)